MILLDSAVAPNPKQLAAAHAANVRWAGYLHSPTTYRGGWAPSALWAAAHALGGVLPVWVGPLGATSAKQGAADARTVLAQLAAAHLSAVVALDTEAAASTKPGALDYARAFHTGIHAAHGETVQYGPMPFLAQLGKLHTGDPGRPDAPWLARWVQTIPNVTTQWPTALDSWSQYVRGTQWTHDRPGFGLTVDLSVCAGLFPLAHALPLTPPKPAPVPTPAPAPVPAPAPKPNPVPHLVTVSIDGRVVVQGSVTLP